MQKTYDKSELQEILDMYANQDTRDEAIKRANQLLTDFVNEDADIDRKALDQFQSIIETFGMETDSTGKQTFTQLGAQAAARFQQIIDALENAENAADKNRIYQLTSDQNQIIFNSITLNVYRDMGLVDASVNPANMTPNAVAEMINSVNLTDKQRNEYSSKFIDNIIANPELFEITPPKILTDAYIFTREQLSANPNDDNLSKRFTTLALRIDYLIKNFAKKVDYFYADPSNIADVYAGYRKMCDTRRKDLKVTKLDDAQLKKYKEEINKSADETMARLNEIVAMYSDMWNLKNLKPEDADKLDARWKEIVESLKDVELTDDVLATLAKYEFKDENGNPLPQFIDSDGKPSHNFQPGYKLNPDGRLNRIISLAKNDVAMRNVGDLDKDIKDIDLTSALFDRVPWKMAEISIPDQVISGIESNPHKMLNQQDVDKFWNEIETNGGSISDVGYQAALDAQVNQAAGFAGLMAEKVGADKPIVMRPFEAIEDIDKLASTRSEKIGAGERKQKVGFFKRIAKNFGAAAIMSAGLTFIGKATGVAYAGAAVGTAIGIGNMIVQGFKWRKEQKKAKKPHGLKAFFSDKRNWGPAVASGLGVAAVISMATGNPELAAGFGIGAMAVGGGSAAKMVYDDALRAGYTKGQALAGAIGVAGATIAGGIVGRAAMNGVINYVNNNTDSNLFKTEHTTTSERVTGTERTYADGVIDHHKDMMLKNHWETPQSFDARIDGLMDAGLSHDDAVRYLLAWHDATDHNLGPGYFNSIGMSPEALAALRGSISGTTINLTPDAMSAFNHFNPHISALNQVGYVPGAPISYNLPANAMYDSNGVAIYGHDFYTTFANGNTPFTDVPIITTEMNSVFTPNELAFPAGIGTLGIYEPKVVPKDYLIRMRERAGVLADRAEKINNGGNDGRDNGGSTNTPGGNTGNPPAGNTPGGNTGNSPAGNTPGGNTGNPPTGIIPGGNTGNPPAGNTPGGNTGTEQPNTKRGFFGKCKDITYKIMQSVYHGLQKTQQGVHNMKKQKIINKSERDRLEQHGRNAVDHEKMKGAQQRARDIGKVKDLYSKHSIQDLLETFKKDAIAISFSDEKLKKKIGDELVKLSGKLELINLEKLNKITSLKQQLEAFNEMGGKDAMETLKELKKLNNEIDKLEVQGKIDLDVARAKGKVKVDEINGEARVSKARKFGRGIASLFRSFGDTTKDDITSADNAAKLAKKKLAKAKTDAAKNVWEKASKRLAQLMKSHEYTEEQKNKIAEAVIQESLRQAENAK